MTHELRIDYKIYFKMETDDPPEDMAYEIVDAINHFIAHEYTPTLVHGTGDVAWMIPDEELAAQTARLIPINPPMSGHSLIQHGENVKITRNYGVINCVIEMEFNGGKR